MIDSFTESINIFYINTFNLFQIYLYFVTTFSIIYFHVMGLCYDIYEGMKILC